MRVFILGHFLLAQLGRGINLGKLVVLEVSALVGVWPFLTGH